MLQQFKHFILEQLSLPPVFLLLAAGFAAFMALNALLRKPLASAWGLPAPLLLGCGLELADIHAHYGSFLPSTADDPLATILARHALDVVAMLAIPVLLVLAGILRARRKNQGENSPPRDHG